MRAMQYAEAINLRAEPGLRDAICEAARREQTSSAEFIRRGLRELVARRGVEIPVASPQHRKAA